MKAILLGILAKAQTLYPTTICHFLVMANHIHMLIVVDNPESVDDFVGYIKRESAHAINKLLGRKKHTVWCDGYDSTIVLDAEKAIERILHIYTNPQTCNLEDKIERYPNLNSWSAFLSGGSVTSHKRIPREIIPRLVERNQTLKQQKLLANHLKNLAEEENTLALSPDAWMSCFPELAATDRAVINENIVNRLRRAEGNLREKRLTPVIGEFALRSEGPRMNYQPKKRGKRTLCLATTREVRTAFISWYRSICDIAKKLMQLHPSPLGLSKLPPGVFSPGGYLRANIFPDGYPPVCNGVV